MSTVLSPGGRSILCFAKVTLNIKHPLLSFVAGLIAAGLLADSTRAVPYASGVTNSGGTISFFLNEAADSVTLRFDGGASSSELGALAAGRHSFNLGLASTFEIVVRKSVPVAWTQISTDGSLTRFFSARGVAVNLDPATPLFGRIYVANAAAGTTAVGGRVTGDGIYILNPDFSDALGRGDTVSSGGLNFTNTATGQNGNTPWRIEVGQDQNLYIADFSTNLGTIYRVDPDVNDGSGVMVLDGQGLTGNPSVHTTIGGSPIVRGGLESANLTIWAIDGALPGNFNRLMRWDVGAGPLLFSGVPTPVAVLNPLISAVANVTTDDDIAPDSKFFVMQNRSAGNEAGLAVLGTDGSLLWDSLAESRSISNNPSATDILRISRAVKVSPDGKRVALIRDDNQTWVMPLTNGIPDLGRRQLVPTFPTSPTAGRDVSWDATGNLYVVSSGAELLRVWSPGGDTTATTRSDGSFSVETVELPEVSVTATTTPASEAGSTPGVFTLIRSGDASSNLTVNIAFAGTATDGADYVSGPVAVTFEVGESSTTVTITPVGDTEAELTESVTLNLVPALGYVTVNPTNATLSIVDDEFPSVTVTTADTNMFEPNSFDTARLVFTRLGDTNVELFGVTYMANGTALAGQDYVSLPGGLTILAGVVSQTVEVSPINDFELEGSETIVVTLDSSTEYNVGTPSSATVHIQDDELLPAPVLFADDFDTDTSVNWTIRFGANNGVFDATTVWADDYSQRGIPSAPRTRNGTTRGLFVQVNKNEAATGGSAGINLYPNGQSFSGDYALRFDMYLSRGNAATGTEHAMAGLNHSGSFTNRFTASTDTNNTTLGGDGIWVGIVTDASNLRDYAAYTYPTPDSLPVIVTNIPGSTLAGVITSPPYAAAGSPGNNGASATKTWAEVEFSQVNGILTLKVNENVIFQHTNTFGFASGNVMIGHNDQFDSIDSSGNAFVIFDNVSVASLAFEVTDFELLPDDTALIRFVSPQGGDASSFVVESTSILPTVSWNTEAATITPNGGHFRAVVPYSGGTKFYRIRR